MLNTILVAALTLGVVFSLQFIEVVVLTTLFGAEVDRKWRETLDKWSIYAAAFGVVATLATGMFSFFQWINNV